MNTRRKEIKGRYGFPNGFGKNGLGTITLMYRVNGEAGYAKHSTGIKVKEKDWDEVNQTLRPSFKQHVLYNNQLAQLKAKIDKMVSEHEGRITKAIIQQMMSGDYVPKQDVSKVVSFREYAHQVNDGKKNAKEVGFSTHYNKELNIDAFCDFVVGLLKKEPTISDIKFEHVVKYVGYRFTKEHNPNKSKEGVMKTLTPIKQALESAYKNGYVRIEEVSPILEYTIPEREVEYKSEVEEDNIRALSETEMQQLCNFQAQCRRQRTKEILDLFFFSFYACGLRISDILTLEWEHVNFEKKSILKNQFKTKNTVSIPLNEKAIEILSRWQSDERNSRFVFDLLSEDFDLSQQKKLFMKRNATDKTFNRSLYSVCDKLKISPPATFHSARHTFAVMALNNGVPLKIVSTLLGHASLVATEKTYAKYLKSTLDDEVCKRMNFSFTPEEGNH